MSTTTKSVKTEKSSDYYRKILLSNIKHDLTNPINAILGYAELIMDYIQDSDNQQLKADINNIHASGTLILENINAIFIQNRKHKNDNIGKLISNPKLQHSIRTPLSTIIGLTELMQEDILLISSEYTEDIQICSKNINHAGKELSQVTTDLIKFSNLSVDELLERYKTDIYSKEASQRLFDFDPVIAIPAQIGKILIVDDDSSNLELLEQILLKSNHKVLCADTGESALKILQEEQSNVDLILLDLIMPGMNGIELLEKIKLDQHYQNIPIIMLSAVDELDTAAECITLGADDFLFKPINRVLLNARINNALENKFFRDKETHYKEKIKEEQEKSDKLLLNILPGSIAKRLKDGETLIADDIESATVLFADLSGFTQISSTLSAQKLVLLLNNIFSIFDELLEKHSIEKIKTIGDNYMLAGGLPEPSPNHAVSVAEMAMDMLEAISKLDDETAEPLHIRIGINSGPLSAGVIGRKKFIYDLWGDTVNVASRMESYGENNKIHTSENTYLLLKDNYQFEKRPKLEIQGKGIMQTYYLTGRK